MCHLWHVGRSARRESLFSDRVVGGGAIRLGIDLGIEG